MDIEKLNLANFVGKVMDEFIVVPDFLAKVYRKIKLGICFAENQKPLLHRKSQNLSKNPSRKLQPP